MGNKRHKPEKVFTDNSPETEAGVKDDFGSMRSNQTLHFIRVRKRWLHAPATIRNISKHRYLTPPQGGFLRWCFSARCYAGATPCSNKQQLGDRSRRAESGPSLLGETGWLSGTNLPFSHANTHPRYLAPTGFAKLTPIPEPYFCITDLSNDLASICMPSGIASECSSVADRKQHSFSSRLGRLHVAKECSYVALQGWREFAIRRAAGEGLQGKEARDLFEPPSGRGGHLLRGDRH